VQADGIVKRFNWYPGIDPKAVRAQLDPTKTAALRLTPVVSRPAPRYCCGMRM
jgi:hypothetical protein